MDLQSLTIITSQLIKDRLAMLNRRKIFRKNNILLLSSKTNLENDLKIGFIVQPTQALDHI